MTTVSLRPTSPNFLKSLLTFDGRRTNTRIIVEEMPISSNLVHGEILSNSRSGPCVTFDDG